MPLSLSERQLEARHLGEQDETVKFLNQYHLIAIIIFIIILISTGLWSELIISLTAKLFRVSRNDMTPMMWFSSALVFTIITYIIIRYIVKVPITAAFSF